MGRSTIRDANQLLSPWVRICVIQWAAVGNSKSAADYFYLLPVVILDAEVVAGASSRPVVTITINMTNTCEFCCADKLVSKNSSMQIQNIRSRPDDVSDLLHLRPRVSLPQQNICMQAHTCI